MNDYKTHPEGLHAKPTVAMVSTVSRGEPAVVAYINGSPVAAFKIPNDGEVLATHDLLLSLEKTGALTYDFRRFKPVIR